MLYLISAATVFQKLLSFTFMLDIHLSISPIHLEKKSAVAWVVSKVTELAVFCFVYFFLSSQLTQLARWQKLSELQILTQTAYFKSSHLLECLFSPLLFLGKQVTFNPSVAAEWDLAGEGLYLHSMNSLSFPLLLEYVWRNSVFCTLQNWIIALKF